MRNAAFTLTPFHWPEKPYPTLTGRLVITEGALRIEYDLSGLNQPADLPTPSPDPARRLQLWQQTCFELLWGPFQHFHYWELNASPTGDWNVFAFSDYRDGMTEEPRITAVEIGTHRHARGLHLVCTVPIAGLEHPGPYRLAPAAIIRLANGQRTFWATHHPGDAPDFHHPLSFTLTA